MSAWLFHRLSKQTERLKDLIKCKRCHLYIHKDLKKCTHCAHLSDHELASLISKRRTFRLTLGKAMLVGAVFVFHYYGSAWKVALKELRSI